ncbi:MAG: hypothetical protein ACYDCK_03730 [Thermoplasmatota archaeon]
MRGLWRPFATLAIVIVGVGIVLALKGTLNAAALLAVAALGFVFFGGIRLAFGLLPVRRFLAGMRDAGATLTVRDESVDWWSNLVAEFTVEGAAPGANGAWRVETENGRGLYLYATPPSWQARTRVHGSARKAGARAARGEREFAVETSGEPRPWGALGDAERRARTGRR